MRGLPVLLAVAVFAVAIGLSLRAVRHGIREPPDQPAAAPSAAVIPAAEPPSPLGRLEAAIDARQWDLAGRIADLPELAGVPQLVRLRDHIRRGARRDAEGVIESKVLVGALSAYGSADAQRFGLRRLNAASAYTLPERRRKDLLVFNPRRLDPAMVASVIDEMRVLRIEGLDLNATGKPLPGLAGAALRYLGGSALDRLPPTVLAACSHLEILDLSACSTGVDGFLAAAKGIATLRILRLPAAHRLAPSGLDALASLTGLEDLSACASGLDATAMERLAATRLRHLRLENHLAPAAFAALGRLSDLRRLTCSLASGCDLAPLAALPVLEELSLSVAAPGASPEWLRFVQARILRLSQPGIDDRHAAGIQRMPLLDRLELSSTAISDAGLLLLASNPRLQALELGSNPGISGAVLPRLLQQDGLRELRLAAGGLPESAVLSCPDPGQLERFTWSAGLPSDGLIEHLIAWPGMVRVAVSGKLQPEVRRRLDAANERRSQVPPDLPRDPALGF